jgi:hypothetical protein
MTVEDQIQEIPSSAKFIGGHRPPLQERSLRLLLIIQERQTDRKRGASLRRAVYFD